MVEVWMMNERLYIFFYRNNTTSACSIIYSHSCSNIRVGIFIYRIPGTNASELIEFFCNNFFPYYMHSDVIYSWFAAFTIYQEIKYFFKILKQTSLNFLKISKKCFHDTLYTDQCLQQIQIFEYIRCERVYKIRNNIEVKWSDPTY